MNVNCAAPRIDALKRQMLIHSYLYYREDSPLISDDDWQRRANELAALIKEHGHQTGLHDNQFHDWDGTTGMHLIFDDWTVAMAGRLCQYAATQTSPQLDLFYQ